MLRIPAYPCPQTASCQPMRQPYPVELQALARARWLLRNYNSAITPELWWDPQRSIFVVAIEYDPRLNARLPNNFVGIPVHLYLVDPNRAKRSGTAVMGDPQLSLQQPYGFGWPTIVAPPMTMECQRWTYPQGGCGR